MYVYRRGDLLWGPGDPGAKVKIDEQSMVLTMHLCQEQARLAEADAGQRR